MPVAVSLVVNHSSAALILARRIVTDQVNAKMQPRPVGRLVEKPNLCVVIPVQRHATLLSHVQKIPPVRPRSQ